MAKSTVWPAVAKSYLDEFWIARSSSANNLRAVVESVGKPKSEPTFAPKLHHLLAMTDDTGMLQHATYSVPNRSHGYCIDDNARAFILTCLLQPEYGSQLDRCQSTYLAFMLHALNEENGRFRNFMSHSRTWLETEGSEDSHGRSLWALGTGIATLTRDCRRQLCISLFQRGADAVLGFTSPRAWAYAILGACKFLQAFPGDRRAELLRDELADRLCKLYRTVSADDWQWFENELAYCNARLPQALIEAGTQNSRVDWLRVGINSLDWLSKVQTNAQGYFAPIGTEGFYVRGGYRAIYDQQAVEAWSTVSANLSAWKATRDERWMRRARTTLAWFKGANSVGESLVDDDMGICHDGLHLDRVNKNCGAESTLSYLTACAEMQLAVKRLSKAEEQASIK